MRIAFIGFGEAAEAIVAGWGTRGDLRGYDIKTETAGTRAAMLARYEAMGVEGGGTIVEALKEAEAIFSTVTADQAVAAAEAAAPHLPKSAFWFDCNSCAPSSKRRAAEIIEMAGGRYVDVAVMAPVHPKRNMVPLLIAGPHAAKADSFLKALPMAPMVVDGPVGAASSIKMIRSVFVKGLEALTAECALAAVAAGVEDAVLPSLKVSHPGLDWERQVAYNLERVMVHGLRRAAEMEEVARTLADLGLPSTMTRSAVEWQRRIALAGVKPPADPIAEGYRPMAEALLPAMRKG